MKDSMPRQMKIRKTRETPSFQRNRIIYASVGDQVNITCQIASSIERPKQFKVFSYDSPNGKFVMRRQNERDFAYPNNERQLGMNRNGQNNFFKSRQNENKNEEYDLDKSIASEYTDNNEVHHSSSYYDRLRLNTQESVGSQSSVEVDWYFIDKDGRMNTIR